MPFQRQPMRIEKKAELYQIGEALYKLPKAYPTLFEEMSTKITKDVTIYLIGGENMRIKGLKSSTKDCDLVLDTQDAVEIITNAVEDVGYTSRDSSSLSKVDSRVQPFIKFSKDNRSDLEIFYNTIIRKFYLSERMKDRAKADEKVFGSLHKLRLRLLTNEDIFLLKAVTDREGDLYDMRRLVQYGNFNWDIVFEELEKQENETGNHFSTTVLDSIDDLIIQTKMKPPIYKKLLHRSTDANILKLIVNDQGMYMDEVISILRGHDLSEKVIRNRIDSLDKKCLLTKHRLNKRVFLRPS
jgi:hypothetical protein